MTGGMALVITACKRPYYLRDTLGYWSRADGIGDLGQVIVALGRSGRAAEQLEVIGASRHLFPVPLLVLPDSDAAAASPGMHRAIGEAGNVVFGDPSVRFAVFGEEDVIVSADVLAYTTWAARAFEHDSRVLAVCAHNQGGQGWDRREPPADENADQAAVRLLPYFNPWAWGTWRDRWTGILEPEWDWECDSGGEMDSGYDWNIHSRILPRHGMLCAVPDASRSQNIGRLEGWAATEESWEFSQSLSFRPVRGPVDYTLVQDDAEVHGQ